MAETNIQCLMIGGAKPRGIANGRRNGNGTVVSNNLHNITKSIVWNPSRSGSFANIVDASSARVVVHDQRLC